jgi:hypothetical protein
MPVIARDAMSCAHLADSAATTSRTDTVGTAQVINVWNTGGDRFRFRKEAALHTDGSLELTVRMRLAPYASTNAALTYSFLVPLDLVKGATFRALVGKSYATEVVTGTAATNLAMLRYIAFSGGRQALVFDLNPYGVTDWQDYCKWVARLPAGA